MSQGWLSLDLPDSSAADLISLIWFAHDDVDDCDSHSDDGDDVGDDDDDVGDDGDDVDDSADLSRKWYLLSPQI